MKIEKETHCSGKYSEYLCCMCSYRNMCRVGEELEKIIVNGEKRDSDILYILNNDEYV